MYLAVEVYNAGLFADRHYGRSRSIHALLNTKIQISRFFLISGFRTEIKFGSGCAGNRNENLKHNNIRILNQK